MYEIYLITNQVNGKVYVGQTGCSIKKRWSQHIYSAVSGKGPHCRILRAAMSKYGVENFCVEVIDYAETKEEMEKLEIHWISFYGSTDRERGYNISIGGRGNKGYKHSEETKAAMSERGKGRKISEEVKEKLRVFSSNRKQTDAAKNKLSLLRGELANHFNHEISSDEILDLYNRNLSGIEIGESLGIDAAMAIRRIKSLGVDRRPNKLMVREERLREQGKEHLINPDSRELDALYRSGMSCQDIGYLYEMSDAGVSYRLRKFGTVMRPRFNQYPKKVIALEPSTSI